MKIAVLGSKGTTLDFLHGFAAQDRYRIDALITLREAVAQQAGVAFLDGPALRAHCAKTIYIYWRGAAANLIWWLIAEFAQIKPAAQSRVVK